MLKIHTNVEKQECFYKTIVRIRMRMTYLNTLNILKWKVKCQWVDHMYVLCLYDILMCICFLCFQVLNENPALQFVKVQWIWQCCDKKKLVPHQPFLIVP